MPVDDDRRGQGIRDLAGRHGRAGAVVAGQQDRELVAAQPRDRVPLPEPSPQPLRDLLQQQVAGVVAEGVIDLFEAVEVEQEQGERPPGARRVEERLPCAIVEQQAVGQARKGVVEGLAPQLLSQMDARGHVGQGADEVRQIPGRVVHRVDD